MTSRSTLIAPRTAWPTIMLAVFAVALMATTLCAAQAGILGLLASGPLAFVAAFVAFTPIHDAAHRSVARKRWVNEIVGRVCSVVLFAPFAAFRFVHLEHHRHTNDPQRDPDYYSGSGPQWGLPLRWLTQDLHYYVVVFRSWQQRPLAERLDVAVQAVAMGVILGALSGSGCWLAAAIWLVASRLAIGTLSFAFDYLPHVPHRVPASEDRYAATRIIEAPGLTVAFLSQNYHLIHHLYPGVPFYRYRQVFRERREKLLAKGARITRWV